MENNKINTRLQYKPNICSHCMHIHTYTRRNHIYFIIIIFAPVVTVLSLCAQAAHGSTGIIVTYSNADELFDDINKTVNHHKVNVEKFGKTINGMD